MPDLDYSPLDPAFAKLSKPAQRALLNARLLTPAELARLTRKQVAALHGVGPTAFPILEAALAQSGLRFKPE